MLKRPLSKGHSKLCYFSPMAKWPLAKICWLIFFFPVPQMSWNFYSIFLTSIGRFVGIFDLIHIYLGIVKSFQTLHYHMVTGGKYGSKTGNKKSKKWARFFGFIRGKSLEVWNKQLEFNSSVKKLSLEANFKAFWLRFAFILSCFHVLWRKGSKKRARFFVFSSRQ